MRYPTELVERVKAEFPDEPHLHKMAKCGSKDLPLMIKPRWETLTPGEILEYLRSGKAHELKEYCEAYKRRLALYYELFRFAFGTP